MDRYVISCVCTLAVFVPLILILRFKFGLRPKSEALILDAKKSGRVVEGELVKESAILGTPGAKKSKERRNRYTATYRYVVAGREYYFHGVAESLPALTMMFYYPEGHPDKAIPETAARPGWRILIMYPLMAAVFVFFYWVVFRPQC